MVSTLAHEKRLWPYLQDGTRIPCWYSQPFVACSAFTHVTTYRLAKSPYATLYTGGSGGFVASTAAPIATGWSDPVPGRVFHPAAVQRLSQRTEIAWLYQMIMVRSLLP